MGMKLSKQQKACVGVLTLACAALLVDRTLLAPSQAAASSTDEYTISAKDSSEAAEVRAESPAPPAASTLSNRLKALATSQQLDPLAVKDAFWPAWYQPNAEEPQPESDSAPKDLSQAFVSAHRLSAVMGSGPGGYAVVDGKCIRLGAAVDEFVLVSIADRSAVFEYAGQRAELKVPMNGKIGG